MQQKINELNELIKELNLYIPKKDKVNSVVSQKSIGWHIHHSLLVLGGITQGLKDSKPENYQSEFNFKRLVVFTLGKIPRGKGKAPKQVIPEEGIPAEKIIKLSGIISAQMEVYKTLNPKNHFKHFSFGVLDLNQTIKLL